MCFLGPPEMRFQLREIIVGKYPHLRAACMGSVDQAGMGELVEDHDITTTNQRGNRPCGRCNAGRENQCRLCPLGCGEFLLQRGVLGRRAADQARRRCPCSPTAGPLCHGIRESRV